MRQAISWFSFVPVIGCAVLLAGSCSLRGSIGDPEIPPPSTIRRPPRVQRMICLRRRLIRPTLPPTPSTISTISAIFPKGMRSESSRVV